MHFMPNQRRRPQWLTIHPRFRGPAQTLALLLVLATLTIAPASISASSASSIAPHLLRPSALRCDGQSNPLAVAEGQPRFSWQLTAASQALHGEGQSAYRIQVAASESDFTKGQSALWDSGVVQSKTSSGVAYEGPPLQAEHRYAWRVRVWDEQGRPTGWSGLGSWTEAPVWHAAWIAANPSESVGKDDPLPLFRKSFHIAQPVKRAVLYASGLGQQELRLNGSKVSDDLLTPGWSDYRKTIFYDSYDVSHLLRQGDNALGVLLGNGMYRVLRTPGRYTKFSASYGPLQCIVQLHIEFASGESIEIGSDGTWKTHPGPITFSSIYGGEDYDARREAPGWDRPGFDAAGWSAVDVVAGPGGTLSPELAPPVRVMQTYAAVKRTQPRPGVMVYDFGQNFAGWPAVVTAGPKGAALKLIPGELLNQDGTVSQRSSGKPQWFTYTLRGAGIESWRPRFSYYGFRYLQVEGAATGSGSDPAHARIVRVLGEAVHSSSQTAGSFASSDELLNRIHELIVRAMENNAQSLFTDCPHREKLGWLEEAHLLAPSMLYDFDFAGLYAATARNIADAQKSVGEKAGMVPEIAPQYVVFDPKYDVFNDSPEWGSAAILAPWYVYQRTGDLQFLSAQIDVMRRYAAYLKTRAHGGIIDYGLGDWYDIGPVNPGVSQLTTAGVTATAIYYQDLRVLEKTTQLLGLSEESHGYHEQAELVLSAFNARFFHAEQHRYDQGSQTAQAMPLALGMVPQVQRAAVLEALVADIRAHQNHGTAGDIGYHYVVDALLDGGRSDVLLDMLHRTDAPSYGYQLAQGATALTEAWDANPANSQDHFMLGDAEEWIYRGLGGIDIDFSRPEDEQLILHPAVTGIAWVHTRYQSAWGMVKSDWRHEGTEVVYDFSIPANTTATLELETSSPGTVLIDGAAPQKASGVISTRVTANTVRIVLASGHYRIRAANPAEKNS
jgi:hypothetical protein